MNGLDKKYFLGIYGDGQLARFLIASAKKQNLSVLVYTLNSKDSPCRELAPLFEGKAWNDRESFESFCQECHVIVLENEFVPPSFLLENKNINFLPSAQSYEQLSDKLKQVKLARSLHIDVPEYSLITNPLEVEQLRLPCMLKSLRGGYDGYGNFALKTTSQIAEAKLFALKSGDCLAQEFIEFESEVAVVIASDGETAVNFPVVETIQEKSICHFTIAPPHFSKVIQDRVIEAAIKLIKAIKGVGIFGVEFFVKGEKIIFNEIAPRVHNSAHFTIEACSFSQFDAAILLAQKKHLSEIKQNVPAVGMLNLLGTQNGPARFEGDENFRSDANGFLHLYGKAESRKGRKMGHYTLLGKDRENILKQLTYLKTRYTL